MKQDTFIRNALFSAILLSSTSVAIADMTVDKSQGQLNISSDINGTVITKIINPVNETVNSSNKRENNHAQ